MVESTWLLDVDVDDTDDDGDADLKSSIGGSVNIIDVSSGLDIEESQRVVEPRSKLSSFRDCRSASASVMSTGPRWRCSSRIG